MRKIAFKAWNKKENKWQHELPCDILGEVILLGAWMDGVPLRDLNEIIILQFTGLCDKKGKDIYEGDYVKSDNHNPSIYKVEFIEGGFCCTHGDIYPIDINHFFPSVGCMIEVVGNEFENPEINLNAKPKP